MYREPNDEYIYYLVRIDGDSKMCFKLDFKSLESMLRELENDRPADFKKIKGI